jgi:hypothetical protein
MKNAWLMLFALGLVPDGSAAASEQRRETARTGRVTQHCPRRPIGYFQAAAELNRVQSGCLGSLECFRSVWGNLETKELAGYALSNWLWSGPAPKTFSIAEQDAMIADARARAQTQRPAGKAIRSIGFFTDFIVPSQGGAYFVGARATYGNCVPGGSLPAR